MKKIALSTFVLALGFASPVLANETVHNGLPVAKPSVESIRATSAQTDFGLLSQGAAEIRSGELRDTDAARGAKSGT